MPNRDRPVDCDLLVCSTDSYLAEARVTIGRLRALGITERFPCRLLTGEARPDVPGFEVLNRRRRGTWSSELREGLEQLDRGYVLLWLDDLVPLEADVEGIVEAVSACVVEGGSYLRLDPLPPGGGAERWPGISEVLPGEVYRTSTVLSLWRREVLLALLDDRESAWQFELIGSARSDPYPAFYASDRFLVRYVNLVIKGVVDPRAERALAARGVDLSGVRRPRMSAIQLQQQRLRDFRAAALRMIPTGARRAVRNLFATNPGLRS